MSQPQKKVRSRNNDGCVSATNRQKMSYLFKSLSGSQARAAEIKSVVPGPLQLAAHERH